VEEFEGLLRSLPWCPKGFDWTLLGVSWVWACADAIRTRKESEGKESESAAPEEKGLAGADLSANVAAAIPVVVADAVTCGACEKGITQFMSEMGIPPGETRFSLWHIREWLESPTPTEGEREILKKIASLVVSEYREGKRPLMMKKEDA
jgi:hypothetical protein